MSDENSDLSFLVEELIQKNSEYEKLVAQYEKALLESEQRNQQYREMLTGISSSRSELLDIASRQVEDKVKLSLDNLAISHGKEKVKLSFATLKKKHDELRISSKLAVDNQQAGNRAKRKKSKDSWDKQRLIYYRYLEEHPAATESQARNYVGCKIEETEGIKPNRSTLERQLTNYAPEK